MPRDSDRTAVTRVAEQESWRSLVLLRSDHRSPLSFRDGASCGKIRDGSFRTTLEVIIFLDWIGVCRALTINRAR